MTAARISQRAAGLVLGALQLALLGAEGDHRAGQRRDGELEHPQLLLGVGDVGRRLRVGLDAGLRRHVTGPPDAPTRDAAVQGRERGQQREHRLDHGVAADAGLAGGPVPVGEQQAEPAQQVGADRADLQRAPTGPADARHAGALVRLMDGVRGAVDADQSHEGPAEPGGAADVVEDLEGLRGAGHGGLRGLGVGSRDRAVRRPRSWTGYPGGPDPNPGVRSPVPTA
jgi:hypothetical protein